VGGRYGSSDPATGLGYTEREYDYAVDIGLPVLGFIHGSPGEIAADRTELDPIPRARLDEFRAKIRTRVCRTWTNADELASQVVLSLTQEIQRNPRVGWVKANREFGPELQAEMAQLRAEVLEQHRNESKPLPDIDPGLQQGDDRVTLRLRMWVAEHGETVVRSWMTTWNRVFQVLGPMLLTETAEETMAGALASAAADELGIMDPTDPQIVPTDFQKAKTQLYALGFVERGGNGGWALTRLGEAQLVKMTALRRDEPEV
jgi:hypothetical protein